MSPLLSQPQGMSGVPDTWIAFNMCAVTKTQNRGRVTRPNWAGTEVCPLGEVSPPWERGGGRRTREELPQGDTPRRGGERVGGPSPRMQRHRAPWERWGNEKLKTTTKQTEYHSSVTVCSK